MQILSVILFGVSASLDALLVGFTFGIRKINITALHNIIISSIALIGTCFSVSMGNLLIQLLPAALWRLLGSMILLLLGLCYLIKCMPLFRPKYQPFVTKDTPSLKEFIVLGFSLSANNMGIGLSASITGLALLPAAIATFVFSGIFLFLGSHFGQCNKITLSDIAADIITGILLVLLGLIQLIGTL